MQDGKAEDPTTPIDGRREVIPHPEYGYTSTHIHVDRPCQPFVAAEGQKERCDQNRGGDFYTACEVCLLCDVPHQAAPDLMAYVLHPGPAYCQWHCVFTRPPTTPEEIEQAINAICDSEVCGIRYGGTDPDIIRRIAARGPYGTEGVDKPLADA